MGWHGLTLRWRSAGRKRFRQDEPPFQEGGVCLAHQLLHALRLTAAQRDRNAVDREALDLTRQIEALTRQVETPRERFDRTIREIGELATRAEEANRAIDPETLLRAGEAAQAAYEGATRSLARGTETANNAARELGLTFSSAFEDAIVRGKSLRDVLEGIGQDLARIMVRRTITEPLGNAVGSVVGSIGSSFGDWIGGLFRAEGGPVTSGQPYIVGERGPEWFVPSQSGTVLPNGTSPGGGMVVHNSINIDARGADAGVDAIEVRQVKTGARLVIPVHPALRAALSAVREDQLTFLLTGHGKAFTPAGFAQRFKEWSAEAGVPGGRSPHGLRKAAARRLAEAGCSAHQIAAVTGHKTLAEVQRYTIAVEQEGLAKAAMARIGGGA